MEEIIMIDGEPTRVIFCDHTKHKTLAEMQEEEEKKIQEETNTKYMNTMLSDSLLNIIKKELL